MPCFSRELADPPFSIFILVSSSLLHARVPCFWILRYQKAVPVNACLAHSFRSLLPFLTLAGSGGNGWITSYPCCMYIYQALRCFAKGFPFGLPDNEKILLLPSANLIPRNVNWSHVCLTFTSNCNSKSGIAVSITVHWDVEYAGE
jgi:hypothetical protein